MPQPEDTVRGRPVRTRIGLGPLIVVAAAVVLFSPFLFLGRHAVAFHYERGSWTGLPGERDGRASRPVPLWYDASPLCIHYPNETLAAEALRRRELPVWNPYAGAGTPGLGGGSVYPFSPFFWPFYLVPNPWVYTAGLLLFCLWGGFGIYSWLGRFGLPPPARGFGAAIWVLSPWVTHFFTFSDVWAGAWFGWLLWAWDRFIEEERAWWLPAAAVAGMVYCGHPEVALILAGASGLYALASWGTSGTGARIPFRTLAAGGVGAVTLAVALTAVHWLPVALRATESLPYKFVSPQALLRSAGSIGDFFSPRTATYLAPPALALALLGLAWLVRSRKVALALLLPVVSLAGLLQPAVLGPINSLLTMDGLIPGFYYRSILWFGLVPLLAAGAASLGGGGGAKKAWGIALLLMPVPIYLAYFAAVAERPGWGWVLWQGVALAVLGVAGGIGPFQRRGLAVALALGLACVDPFVLFNGCLSEKDPYSFKGGGEACTSRFSTSDPSNPDPSSWGVAKGLLDRDHGRMWAGTGGGAAGQAFLAPNLGTVWKVRDLRIQDVLLGRRMAILHQTVQGPAPSPYFASLYYSGTAVQDLALLGVSHLGRPVDEDSGRFVWEKVAGAHARAYLVHEIRPAASEEESARLWREGLTDRDWFKGGAILEGWTGATVVGGPSDSDAVAWLEDGLARVRLKATAREGAVLVLLDAAADGWESRVDGLPVPLYPANLAFRAVAIPPGTHEVTFTYRAPGLVRGLVLAAIGWVSAIVLALSAQRRPKRDSRAGAGGMA